MSRRAATTPEGAVLSACLDLLRLRGWPHWRANVGAARLPGRGGKPRLVRFGFAGCSDILFLVPDSLARLGACECKAPGGKPTADQLAFLDAVEMRGGVALIVDDVADLSAAMDVLAADPAAVIPFSYQGRTR